MTARNDYLPPRSKLDLDGPNKGGLYPSFSYRIPKEHTPQKKRSVRSSPIFFDRPLTKRDATAEMDR